MRPQFAPTVNASKVAIKDNSATEKAWIKRITAFTKTREKYRYPQIGWNTRDIGDYQVGDKVVKSGVIFRSAALNGITNAGAQQFKSLWINKVVDLRSSTEKDGIKALPDPNEAGSKNSIDLAVQYFNYPTNTAAQKQAYKKAKKRAGEIYVYGKPFTDFKTARKSYQNIFKLALANQNGAILYHCLNGHDRTGLVTVVLLSALGVDKATIYNDYLLTNYYQHKDTYTHQAAQLDRFYQTVDKSYGSMQNYLRKGIGLTSKQQTQLKQMYLVQK